MTTVPFADLFTLALRGWPCTVSSPSGGSTTVPVHTWTREPDAADLAMLDACRGPVLDVGCGPGRLTAGLRRSGVAALGIDVVAEAVTQTRRRGGDAIEADVFGAVPHEGTWGTALLADGNIGIGGDPAALLARLSHLLDPCGRVVVELAGPGVATRTRWTTLSCAGRQTRQFPWAVVGVDGVDVLARRAGFEVLTVSRHGERWWAVLTRNPPRVGP